MSETCKGDRVLINILGPYRYLLTCDHCEATEEIDDEEFILRDRLDPEGCRCPERSQT